MDQSREYLPRLRNEVTRQHNPRVLRFDVSPDCWKANLIEVPHQPFDDVFYPAVKEQAVQIGESMFINGLAALQSARTSGGTGLAAFLDANLSQFSNAVADEIRTLAKEVLSDGK